MEKEILKFDEIQNIQSLTCVLGLSFPEIANEFQKAFLTLAHLMASCRDYVLKGSDVPRELLWVIDQLNEIIINNELNQR